MSALLQPSRASRRARSLACCVGLFVLVSFTLGYAGSQSDSPRIQGFSNRLRKSASYVSSGGDPENNSPTGTSFLPVLPPAKPLSATQHRLETVDRLYRMGHMNWLDYLEHLDDTGLAPLTKEAQRWIYEKQHPSQNDCKSTKKFLVSEGTEQIGLGAYLHKQGMGLGAALEFDLVFVMNDVGWNNGQFDFSDDCGSFTRKLTSLECFAQPLSSCDVRDAKIGDNAYQFARDMWGSITIEDKTYYKDQCPTYLRQKLEEHFDGVSLTDAFFKLWWRGQSSAYLSRLNAQTSDALLKLRLDAQLHRTWSHGDGGLPSLGIRYPMPPGTMNLHVRHGDKASEMTLMPFTTYVDAAEKFTSENPQVAVKRLFVSSEDPGVIADASRLPEQAQKALTSPANHWQVYTSDIPRVDSGPFQQIEKYGPTTMTRSWYLQLWMALECDSYIGTRASNWNRIIDEFRCIYVDKCQLPYFEMGLEKDWAGYFW
ncbi:hypothetical protein HKX48_007605 [Thoreauomyces humboldtii]|nr:hypothetical protein HKX48_007605 [Thoreauomyces humboldtii]